ncbi:hypothetical protein BH11MYX1_BH11MYX1_48570 [soil metagenome]
MEELVARGRDAWPKVAIDVAAFARHLAQLENAGALEIEDLYLAFAAAAGDPAALAGFDVLLAQLRGPLKKLGVEASDVDEVMQQVRTELLVATAERAPRLLGYGGRGKLGGWLRSVGLRKGLAQLRTTRKYDPLDHEPGTLAGDPELAYMKKHYGEVFQRAFAAALAGLAPKDRLLLKQRFRHAMGVEDLGRQYGVNAGTITRRVQAARAALVDAIRTAMMASLGVDAADVASILRLIQSQLDVSLSTVGA